MVNPIRFNTPPNRPNPSNSGASRPERDEDKNKNFEKVLKRDRQGEGREEKNDDEKIKDKKAIGNGESEQEENPSMGKKEKPASIFDLSRSKSNPPPNTQKGTLGQTGEEGPSSELMTEIAENRKLAEKDLSKEGGAHIKAQTEGAKESKALLQESENLATNQSRDVEAQKQLEQSLAAKKHSDQAKVNEKGKGPTAATLKPEEKEKRPTLERSSLSSHALAESQQQAPVVNSLGDAKPTEGARQTEQMKALIEKIVSEMQVIQTGEATDVVITIQHPPVFEGAQVKVTTFESARGEINITFENLTQQAKEILDSKVNRESLLLALNKEGYNVHILTTSTAPATPIYTAEAQQRDQEQQGKQGGQQGREQEQEKKDQKKK